MRTITRRGMSVLEGLDANLEHVLSFASMNRTKILDEDKLKKIIGEIYRLIDFSNPVFEYDDFIKKFNVETEKITFKHTQDGDYRAAGISSGDLVLDCQSH